MTAVLRRMAPAVVAVALGMGVAGATAQDRGPIEIAADALELDQDAGVAVASGNVTAVQGDVTLTADRLAVAYTPAAGAGPDVIRRLDATGNVTVALPGQTARGDAGSYDVDSGIITLTGSVVLTRGDNVVRGETLVLNLNTGTSRIDGGAGDGDGRVRGLFVPAPAAAEGGAGP